MRLVKVIVISLVLLVNLSACSTQQQNVVDEPLEGGTEEVVEVTGSPRDFSDNYTLETEGHKLLDLFEIEEPWGDGEYHFVVPTSLDDTYKVYFGLFYSEESQNKPYKILNTSGKKEQYIWIDTDANGVQITVVMSSDVDSLARDKYIMEKYMGLEFSDSDPKTYISIYIDRHEIGVIEQLILKAESNSKKVSIDHSPDYVRFKYTGEFDEAGQDIIDTLAQYVSTSGSGGEGAFYSDSFWFIENTNPDAHYALLVCPSGSSTIISIIRDQDSIDLLKVLIPESTTSGNYKMTDANIQLTFEVSATPEKIAQYYDTILTDKYSVAERLSEKGELSMQYSYDGIYTNSAGDEMVFEIKVFTPMFHGTKVEVIVNK